MSTSRVVLDGKTRPGFASDDVCRRLAALVNQSDEVAARLLSGKPATVKSGVDQATATRYVTALTEIGVVCRVELETLNIEIGETHANSDNAASLGTGDNVPSDFGRQSPSRANKASDEKYCSECGATIKAKAEICPKCGVRQLAPQEHTVYGQPAAPVQRVLAVWPSGSKSRIGAALFAIFLGGFGIHKFYLGQSGQGVLYLLFCWAFIPFIIGFIEGIVYLCTSDQSFAREYG